MLVGLEVKNFKSIENNLWSTFFRIPQLWKYCFSGTDAVIAGLLIMGLVIIYNNHNL